MLDTSQLSLFLFACIAIQITPGPAVFYVITRSITQGRLAGFVSVLGLETGAFVQAIAAALGLAAAIHSSEIALTVIKFAGAGYLVYIGCRTLLTYKELQQNNTNQQSTLRQTFQQGLLVNLLNTKMILFFLAFLPQFIEPAIGNVALQTFLLGSIFVATGLCTDVSYALLAGTAAEWLKASRHFAKGQYIFAGCMYILLGLSAVFVL